MKNKITQSLSLATKTLILVAVLFFGISTTKAQIITTIAGTGTVGYSGDGGPADSAEFNTPFAIFVDHSGNMYITDANNNVVRKVTASTGIITTIAGTGIYGFSGDNGQATNAQLNGPEGIFLDTSGNVYISDAGNNRIRKITASTGIITTIAGTGVNGYSGDGGLATSAKLNYPRGVYVNTSGNVYISDFLNNRIRKITASTGIISTIVGTGVPGFSGDGGPADSAKISGPTGITLDVLGNIYFGEEGNYRVRKVTASTGIITTIAGNGIAGYSGDGVAATSTELYDPQEVRVDAAGNVYIDDWANNRIRKITISTGIITTIVGNGTAGYSGDGGLATNARLNSPYGIYLDAVGSIYIADFGNNRIRKISCSISTYHQIVLNTTNTSVVSSVDTVVTIQVDTMSNTIIITIDSVFITSHLNATTIITDSIAFRVSQCTNIVDSTIYADTTSSSIVIFDTVIYKVSDTVGCTVSVHSQVLADTTNTSILVSIDTLVTIKTDTISKVVTEIITTTDSIFISTYLNTTTVVKDSTVLSVNQCDSSVTTKTYSDTTASSTTNYDTTTHQSADTTTLLNTGLENIDLSLAIKVYPNPFANELNVDVGDQGSTIVLTDALGRTIMQTKDTGHVILQPNVLSGVYFLRVTDKNKSSTIIKVIAE